MKRHTLAGLPLPICLALATLRINQDKRGVWTGQAPGVEVIYLPDQAGPALWVYLRDSLVWQVSYPVGSLSGIKKS